MTDVFIGDLQYHDAGYLYNPELRKLPTDAYYLNMSLDELEEYETLCEGQADDLKVEDGNYRVWLSRCGIEDGEPFKNTVTVERYSHDSRRWEDLYRYGAM